MSLRVTPYPEYKDSAVEWLGKIPAHWKVLPIRAFTATKSIRGRSDLPLLSVYREYGVILRNSRDDNHNSEANDPDNCKVVDPGDLVLNKMKTWQGSLGVSKHQGIVSPAYIVCTVSKAIDGRFLHTLLRSRNYIAHYNRLSFGVRIGQWDMRYDDFKHIPLCVPPIEEQVAIVRFLDILDRRVNRLLRIKRRLIELLNEQKQAIIQRAVTKGTNPDVPMKPSGIDWLDSLPAHWDVIPLKRIFVEVDSRTQTGEDLLLSLRIREGLIPDPKQISGLITSSNIIGYKRIQPGQVVMNRMQAANGLFAIASLSGVVSPDYAIFQTSVAHPEYFIQLFKTSPMKTKFRQESKGLGTGMSGFLRLYTDKFGVIKVPFPPPVEQQQILREIKDTSVDGIITQTQDEIELIKEYRSRLIADVVTGKLDVRGEILPEAFPGLEDSAENLFDEADEQEEIEADVEEMNENADEYD